MTASEATQAASSMVRVAVNPDGIPHQLKIRPQFVGWEAELKPDGKLNKIPMIAGTDRRASSTDLLTWCPFEEAYKAYEAGIHDGIGFMLCSADPYCFVDLDKCVDPKTGEVSEWARAVVEKFKRKYVELSPTGTGLHVLVHGVLRGGIKGKRVEVYGQDRFMTLTGQVVSL